MNMDAKRGGDEDRSRAQETPRRRYQSATPRGSSTRFRSGRYTGSRASSSAPPSQVRKPSGVWRTRGVSDFETPLAYRCGGSTGITPVSRLTSDSTFESEAPVADATGMHSRTVRACGVAHRNTGNLGGGVADGAAHAPCAPAQRKCQITFKVPRYQLTAMIFCNYSVADGC